MWLASDNCQVFLTSKVTSPSYQTAQQLVTILISLTETKQSRFAEIIWVLLLEMALLLAAKQELNRKIIIIRKRSRMNIWGWAGVGDFSQGSGEEEWASCLLPTLQLGSHFNLQLGGSLRVPLYRPSLLSTPSSASLSFPVYLNTHPQL